MSGPIQALSRTLQLYSADDKETWFPDFKKKKKHSFQTFSFSQGGTQTLTARTPDQEVLLTALFPLKHQQIMSLLQSQSWTPGVGHFQHFSSRNFLYKKIKIQINHRNKPDLGRNQGVIIIFFKSTICLKNQMFKIVTASASQKS